MTESFPYLPYAYLELTADPGRMAFLLDCYECLGWEADPRRFPCSEETKLLLRRERKIRNKMELTRLQNHLEACIREIDMLEASKTAKATAIALITGILGIACMAGSVFAITADPPVLWLCILLAIPAFSLWGLAPLVYHKLAAQRSASVNALIEKKYEQICEICEKGSKLL